MDNRIQALCDFIDSSHSVYHAQDYLVNVLNEQGFTALPEAQTWDIVPGGKYYVCRGNATVIAFRIPSRTPQGFLISAAHVDRPGFKVKENGEQISAAYTRLVTEVYGSPLLGTWTDRPLSLAGRVMVETENGAEIRLFDIDRDLMLIPNLAIHMNRQSNDGIKWNPAVDTLPLLGGKDAKSKFHDLMEETAGGRIIGHDLYLYVRAKAAIWGIDNEYLSAPALDDLQSVWGSFQGFLKAEESGDIPVFCAMNSEEIGSRTANGADSTIISDVLARISKALNLDVRQLLAQSFLISADNAHALHPNHPEMADAFNAPVVGQGPVLKFNARQCYCTDGLCAAVFRKVCQKAGVNVQTYYNRADVPGGSTLGCISISHVSIPTADIGLPQLAMHSCYETASVADSLSFEDAMRVYFSSTLTLSEESFQLQ